MLLTTQGLVLHTTKYGESSLIAKIFTRELGLCSYIIKGVRSAKGRSKQNLLQPLSHLELTVYNNPKKELQYIKEMHVATPQNNACTDSVRMALMFFMDEVLYKSLKEEEPNQRLFDYVIDELKSLDQNQNNASGVNTMRRSTFPIEFMIHASRHLGIEPMNNYSSREPLFNLKEGRFLASPSALAYKSAETLYNVDYFLDAASSSHFHYCLSSSLSHTALPHLTPSQRRTMLNNLLEYYHVHLPDFRNFTSHEVLHSVLN